MLKSNLHSNYTQKSFNAEENNSNNNDDNNNNDGVDENAIGIVFMYANQLENIYIYYVYFFGKFIIL